MKTLRKFAAALLAVVALLFGSSAHATDTYPDPTTLYSALSTPFNAALTWVIGAIGVMVVIGWILKAVRRK
jgi:hypothetical protein